MPTIAIYLKGWADRDAYMAAVNDPSDPLHDRAMKVRNTAWQTYEPGEDCYHAVTYTETGTDHAALCERAFERFNIGDPLTDDVVRAYRNARHRSLSVGDVVVIDGNAYTVAPMGFWPVPNFSPTSSTE